MEGAAQGGGPPGVGIMDHEDHGGHKVDLAIAIQKKKVDLAIEFWFMLCCYFDNHAFG